MGTNYYIDQRGDCPTCTRTHICQLHLGKSSMGWKFNFAWNDGEYYKTEAEMREFTRDKKIWNEYDEPISYEDFWKMVDAKKDSPRSMNPDEYPDHVHVGEDGTFFMRGEFS